MYFLSVQVYFTDFAFNKATEVPRDLATSMLKYFDLETNDINAIIEDHERVRNTIMNVTKESTIFLLSK